jgi:hypothetical protein
MGLALAGLGLAAGCDNPLACQRIAQRQCSLKWTARLKRDFEFIKQDEQTHREMFARDLCQIQARFDYDVQRWQERQCDYLRYFEEMLRGEPESLESTAIILFY